MADIAPIVALLSAQGWVEAGATATIHVRVGTVESPIYGGIGGKIVQAGGRQRLVMPGTTRRVSVGPRTVSFYRLEGRDILDMQNFKTGDVEAITLYLGGSDD
jgi:hypothetical protein